MLNMNDILGGKSPEILDESKLSDLSGKKSGAIIKAISTMGAKDLEADILAMHKKGISDKDAEVVAQALRKLDTLLSGAKMRSLISKLNTFNESITYCFETLDVVLVEAKTPEAIPEETDAVLLGRTSKKKEPKESKEDLDKKKVDESFSAFSLFSLEEPKDSKKNDSLEESKKDQGAAADVMKKLGL